MRYAQYSFDTRRFGKSSAVSINFSTAVRQAIKDYRLFQANYGTVYACLYDGRKAFTSLVFLAVGNSISVQRTTVEPALTAAGFSLLPSLRQNIFRVIRRDTDSTIKKHKTSTVPRGNNFVLMI